MNSGEVGCGCLLDHVASGEDLEDFLTCRWSQRVKIRIYQGVHTMGISISGFGGGLLAKWYMSLSKNRLDGKRVLVGKLEMAA